MDISLLHFFWFAFATVASIQIFYYIYFFSRLAAYKLKEEPLPGNEAPLISVIICAKNEERNLQRNLPKILQQHYYDSQHEPRYEVVVVNDNSEDDTSSVLRYLGPGYPHFHFVELQQSAKGIPGKKYPLTIGIKKSAYDTLVLTDADCKPAGTRWLELIAERFNNGAEIVLGYGAYESKPGLLNKVVRFETFFSAMQYLSFALAGIPYMGVGRNLAYKKDLFFRHKGFLSHADLPSGDDDLFINAAANKKNTTVLIDPEAITYSEPKISWGAWFRQKKRHLSTGKHYKPKHKFLLGLFSISQFLYYPFFIVALFYHPFLYYTIGIFFLRLIITFIVWKSGLKKLNERNLFWYCLPLEIMMCIYYLIFTPALIRKPKKSWN
ncbi:MAG: glycosyltransferase [Chitinophagaceae bacterium]|nr:MAG: glycosyltransferase [Chitinophagaceae bacterium]